MDITPYVEAVRADLEAGAGSDEASPPLPRPRREGDHTLTLDQHFLPPLQSLTPLTPRGGPDERNALGDAGRLAPGRRTTARAGGDSVGGRPASHAATTVNAATAPRISSILVYGWPASARRPARSHAVRSHSIAPSASAVRSSNAAHGRCTKSSVTRPHESAANANRPPRKKCAASSASGSRP